MLIHKDKYHEADVSFYCFPDDKTIVAELKLVYGNDGFSNTVTIRGVARKHKLDTPNRQLGKAVAWKRVIAGAYKTINYPDSEKLPALLDTITDELFKKHKRLGKIYREKYADSSINFKYNVTVTVDA